MWKATDDEVLAWALERNAVVVTLDADFHAILAVSGARGPSVIRLRMQGLRAQEVLGLLPNVLVRFAADLMRGCLITVKERKTTCHKLPVGDSR